MFSVRLISEVLSPSPLSLFFCFSLSPFLPLDFHLCFSSPCSLAVLGVLFWSHTQMSQLPLNSSFLCLYMHIHTFAYVCYLWLLSAPALTSLPSLSLSLSLSLSISVIDTRARARRFCRATAQPS